MSRPSVVIVDSGGANIGSVTYALRRLGVEPRLTADADVIRAADRVILPGVGAAAPAMARLRAHGLVDVLRGLQQPLVGICLGMQLLYERSTESPDVAESACLGLLAGDITRLAAEPGLRIPHMGWNVLVAAAGGRALGPDVELGPEPRAYFVHSYAAPVTGDSVYVATHGRTFTAVARHANVWGFQFHPERSGAVGAALLRAFVEEGDK